MKNADLLKSLKTLLCIPLTVETGLCPKAARLLPGVSSLVCVHAVSRLQRDCVMDCSAQACLSFTTSQSLLKLMSQVSSSLNVPFGTQGRSWKLQSRSRGQERLPGPGAHSVSVSFI